MKGHLKIETVTRDGQDGVQCECMLEHVGFADKVHIMAIVFQALELDTVEEVSMITAVAAAARASGLINGTSIKLAVPDLSGLERDTEPEPDTETADETTEEEG